MENYQGDLTDIFRASGGTGASPQSHDNIELISNWEFQSDPLSLCSSLSDHANLFGDPFCNMRDPLLHELNVATASASAGSCYFGSPPNSADILSSSTVDETSTLSGVNSTTNNDQKVFEDEMNKSPCDIFSRIQISQSNPTPADSPVVAATSSCSPPTGFKASSMVSIDIINTNTSKSCFIDNTGPLQISSPRNLGIKRRKSQAKKVVCIPAPAAANSRPSGEVVPSDLWAWRKYGQKPIKGSPYPRGYYRCSSSKGCSARKQVERSRTDPNMLVITYTSEHNHPWPTQRNALAGSTRSQPPKTNNAASSKTSPTQPHHSKTKEEHKESSNDTLSPDPKIPSAVTAPVKQEINNEDFEKHMEMDHDAQNQFPYRPTLPDSNHTQSDDFFADLGEIEADPLDLLFTQGGFSHDHDQKQTKALDPFSLFDWSGDENNTIGEGKTGL